MLPMQFIQAKKANKARRAWVAAFKAMKATRYRKAMRAAKKHEGNADYDGDIESHEGNE